MTSAAFIQALAAVGVFPSRAFIPAFLTVALLKFGTQMPIVSNWPLIQNLIAADNGAGWLTHNLTFALFGALALLELASQKNQDLREILNVFDQGLKALMAALLVYGLSSVTETKAPGSGQTSSGLWTAVPPLLTGSGVYLAAGLRRSILWQVSDLDPDDSLGFQAILSWLEDFWSIFAVFFLLAMPAMMLVVTSLILLLLLMIQRISELRDEQTKTPCLNCQTPIYPCASTCYSCGHKLLVPCSVGFFSQPVPHVPADPIDHRFRLAEKRRCPNCASRIRKRTPYQTCPICSHDLSGDPDFFIIYRRRVERRLLRVLAVCTGLSLLPVVGLVPGLLYYRFQLVAPFRYYLPPGYSLLSRWTAKLICFVLLMFQWVPGLGAVSIPLMALVNFNVYRRAFLKTLHLTPRALSGDNPDSSE